MQSRRDLACALPGPSTARKGAIVALLAATVSWGGGPAWAGGDVEPPRNAVYVELGGTCVIGSVSYERRLASDWPLRIAFGALPPISIEGSSNAVILLPAVTVGRLFGRREAQLELALGGLAWAEIGRGQPGLFATATIGYRYQTEGGGLVFRVGATPLLKLRDPEGSHLNPTFHPWAGLSLGTAW